MNYQSYKSGYVTIIGKPNVGKSTLLNQVLDYKISITTPKSQTTRRNVVGILNKEAVQIIFIDTPGLLNPKYNLQKAMMKNVNEAITDTDILIYMTELSDKNIEKVDVNENIALLKKFNPQGIKVILVINKIDLYSKGMILPLIELYRESYPFLEIIPVSALKNDGVVNLVDVLRENLPYHPPYYDPDILTEQPERFFVAELIREQIYFQYQEEIPYSSEVIIENFKEREKGKTYIHASVIVERESQKAILIGKAGQALKRLGTNSRKSIEDFLGKPIFLELFVKVKKDWRKDNTVLKNFGY